MLMSLLRHVKQVSTASSVSPEKLSKVETNFILSTLRNTKMHDL